MTVRVTTILSIAVIEPFGDDTFKVTLEANDGRLLSCILKADVLLDYAKFVEYLMWEPGKESYEIGSWLKRSWEGLQGDVREYLKKVPRRGMAAGAAIEPRLAQRVDA